MDRPICIIEDEIDIVRLIRYNLEKEGFTLVDSGTALDIMVFIKQCNPCLILLDVMIPGGDGFDVCKQVKSNPETAHIPIIMITAKTEVHHIVTGLALGADDYITKPFNIAVLIARVNAVLRRYHVSNHNASANQIYNAEHDVLILKDQYQVKHAGNIVPLNISEFNLLCCLANTPGRVFSRSQLIGYMKGENYYVTARLIDVILVSLRKKLGTAAALIETVRGVGYRFKAQ
jgi:two-component system alkaline phosphatase synthesis response regulator PhoP